MLDWKERKNNARDRFPSGRRACEGWHRGSFSLSPRRAHDFLYTGRPMYRIPFGTMTSRLTRWKKRSRPGNFEGRTAADGVGDGYNCVGCGCTASD